MSSEAQVNTQEYGRRPYGVGFLVIGQDQTGPHLYEFSPSGTSYEYYAMSIGARSQSAKTYLEKNYEQFWECKSRSSSRASLNNYSCSNAFAYLCSASLEDLIRHGLHALRETLQQDKDLSVQNTSIGIIGPAGPNETLVAEDGSFRILEGDAVQPYLTTMVPKAGPEPAAGAAAAAADEDVQMAE